MDYLNHQSNGAKGLRVAASVCIVLGWLSVVVGFIIGVANEELIFVFPFGIGVFACLAMYLLACSVRALASLAEAAQLYYNQHAPVTGTEEE